MEQTGIRHLPVVDGAGTVVGMLSDRDILTSGNPAGAGSGRNEERRVDEIMSQPVRTIHSDVDLDQIVELMIMHRISALPVVDDGELKGMLTKTNLMRWFLEFCRANPTLTAATYTVRHCMQHNVLTVQPEDSASVAIQKMAAAGVQHVPVVQGPTLEGIVSDRDVRKHLGLSINAIHRVQYEPSELEIKTLVRSIMTANPTTIEPAALMSVATETMLENRFSALPVVFDRALAGIVTETDVIRLVRSLVLTTVA
jgi:CBS domain-containing protein